MYIPFALRDMCTFGVARFCATMRAHRYYANSRNKAPRAILKLLIIWRQAYRGLPFAVLNFLMHFACIKIHAIAIRVFYKLL